MTTYGNTTDPLSREEWKILDRRDLTELLQTYHQYLFLFVKIDCIAQANIGSAFCYLKYNSMLTVCGGLLNVVDLSRNTQLD